MTEKYNLGTNLLSSVNSGAFSGRETETSEQNKSCVFSKITSENLGSEVNNQKGCGKLVKKYGAMSLLCCKDNLCKDCEKKEQEK